MAVFFFSLTLHNVDAVSSDVAAAGKKTSSKPLMCSLVVWVFICCFGFYLHQNVHRLVLALLIWTDLDVVYRCLLESLGQPWLSTMEKLAIWIDLCIDSLDMRGTTINLFCFCANVILQWFISVVNKLINSDYVNLDQSGEI